MPPLDSLKHRNFAVVLRKLLLGLKPRGSNTSPVNIIVVSTAIKQCST